MFSYVDCAQPCLKISLYAVLWGIAIGYHNARSPDMTIYLYNLADSLLGIVMPLCLIGAAVSLSLLLKYVTDPEEEIDARDIIPTVLKNVKLDKDNGWTIHDIFESDMKQDDGCGPSCCNRMCCGTWILGAIVSINFILSVSYFIDKTFINSFTLQDWPDRRTGNVDCFLSNSFLYVSPREQELTDRLHNCAVFFEQCQSNCNSASGDKNFNSCVQGCANCLSQCTTTLRSDLDSVKMCNSIQVEGLSSCPVSNTACIASIVSCDANTSSSSSVAASTSGSEDAASTSGSGDAASSSGSGVAAEITPIVFSNNTERLERCADLLQTCSVQVSVCTVPNCTELQQCNTLLQECRKSPDLVCFKFLQFGRFANVLEANAESYGVFISISSFFYATFVLMHVFMRFKVTKWWAVLVVFIKITAFAVIVWLLDITTEFIILKNTIKIFQVLCGIVYIIFIIALFLAIEKLEKPQTPDTPKEQQKPENPKTKDKADIEMKGKENENTILASQDDTKSYAETKITDSVGSDSACTTIAGPSQHAGTAGSEPEDTTRSKPINRHTAKHMDSK